MTIAQRLLAGAVFATAGASLATAASAAVVHLNSCGELTAPGSYVLTKNANATGIGPCFTISANDVTLDLGGHSVTSTVHSGAGVAVNPGPNSVPRTGIRIKHGSIGSFIVGIRATDAVGIIIENVGSGVNLEDGISAGIGAVLLNVEARQNGNAGARVGPGSYVSHGLFDGNALSGISAGPGSRILDNSSTFNRDGIVVTSPFTTDIERNSAEGNAVDGIIADCPAFIDGNLPAKFFPNGADDFLARQTDILMPGPSFTSDECSRLQAGTKLTKSRIDGFPDR